MKNQERELLLQKPVAEVIDMYFELKQECSGLMKKNLELQGRIETLEEALANSKKSRPGQR